MRQVYLPEAKELKALPAKKELGAVILAAGSSARIGLNKAELLFDSHYSFAGRLAEVFHQFGCAAVVIVGGRWVNATGTSAHLPHHASVTLVFNPFPELGRLYSLGLGLKNLDNSISRCFVQNVDNPFLSLSTLSRLYRMKNRGPVIVPRYQGRGGHPVLFSRLIIDHILEAGNSGERLDDVLKIFSPYSCSMPDEEVLVNINTKEDYRYYFEKRIR